MITFRDLDGDIKRPTTPASSLDAWYDKVRDVPISELETADICRACRQELFLEHLLPIAFQRLRNDSLAGSVYDGELAVSISRIPLAFWSNNKAMTVKAFECISEALPQIDDDESVKLEYFLNNIAPLT